MAETVEIVDNNEERVIQVNLQSNDIVALKTKNSYIDKDIIIKSINQTTPDGPLNLQNKTVNPSTNQQIITADTGYNGLDRVVISAMPTGEINTPNIIKGEVTNHSINVTPQVTHTTGYIEGGTEVGNSIAITAAELVSGSETISTNTTTDVTNIKEVITDVNPIIYVKDVTIATDSTRQISFTGLPSEPIAWTLDCTTFTTSIDNEYRCISARKDNTGIYTYTIYKRKGNNTCYVYYQTLGFTETYSNGTLTLAATTAGGAEYCGSFTNKTYRLMAVCKNDGRNDIFI